VQNHVIYLYLWTRFRTSFPFAKFRSSRKSIRFAKAHAAAVEKKSEGFDGSKSTITQPVQVTDGQWQKTASALN
jgi:hypothetical protein